MFQCVCVHVCGGVCACRVDLSAAVHHKNGETSVDCTVCSHHAKRQWIVQCVGKPNVSGLYNVVTKPNVNGLYRV